VRQSVILGIVTFTVLYTWYLSLDRTRVAPNTSIYQTACVFVYGGSPNLLVQLVQAHRSMPEVCANDWIVTGFSIWLFGERLTAGRVTAVVLCVGGVFMVAFGSTAADDTATESAIGYVLLIVSTILYALYEVLYQYLAPNDPANELVAPLVVLGLIGVVTGMRTALGRRNAATAEREWWFAYSLPWLLVAGALWIGLPILHWAGFEPFEWPPGELAGPLVLSMFMESVYNLALFLGIVFTSPLFMSIGAMAAVPAAVIVDWMLFGYLPSGLAWAGIALIAVGYFLLNVLPMPPPRPR